MIEYNDLESDGMNRLNSFLSDGKKFWGVVIAGAAVALLGLKLFSWTSPLTGRSAQEPADIEWADSLSRPLNQAELVLATPGHQERESSRFSVLANWLIENSRKNQILQQRIDQLESAVNELQRELARDPLRDTGGSLGRRSDSYSESGTIQKL